MIRSTIRSTIRPKIRPTNPAGAVALLLLAAGCAAAPAPAAKRPSSATQLNDWRIWSSPREASALRGRLAPYRKAPACFDARVGDALDAAHRLFLGEGDPTWRRLLAASFARRGEPAYAASAQASAKAPGRHTAAREALAAALLSLDSDPAAVIERATNLAQTFTDLGDPLFASEAGLVARIAQLSWRERPTSWPTARCQTQRVALAFARLSEELVVHHKVSGPSFRQAAEQALAAGHLVVLQRLEGLRKVAVGEAREGDSGFPRRWARGLTTASLKRGQAMTSLQHALTTERLSVGSPREQSTDRLLRARASFLAGRRDAALAEAQQAAELASGVSPRAEAEALAFLGEVLLSFRKLDNAAGAFQKARALFDRYGHALSAARQQLNLVVAWLKAGDLGEAEAALQRLEPRSLSGEGAVAVELQTRIQVVGALFRLVARKQGPQDVIHIIETALNSARAAGAYAVVESYAGLVDRLRRRARRRS